MDKAYCIMLKPTKGTNVNGVTEMQDLKMEDQE